MGLGTLLGGGAVRELLRLSPQIITAAQQVYATVSKNRRQGCENDAAHNERIIKLEAADVAQAELLAQMAQQLQVQSKAIDNLASRLRLVTALAVGALALAILLALAFLLWR